MRANDAVIVEALRTPVGRRRGRLSGWHPVDLAAEARLMTSLVAEMERSGVRYGFQAVCEGGGMANATLLELCA